jgi:lipopolysaccharide/colanic/teichoic acid biosynthesis glycosyltransferase
MGMLFNRLVAFIAIIVLSPLLIITTIGILISDFGPIIYKAKRAGKNGTVLNVLKFRSMKVSKKVTSKITSKNDPRVFYFGKIIRLLKIDELPQLFNILKGEMSVVGPRPEDLFIVQNHYDAIMSESLSVNPGLASPGSLYNYTHIEDSLTGNDIEKEYINKILPLKVKIDVVYVRNKSFFYDLKIITKTMIIIFQKALGKKDFALPKEYFLASKL